MKKILAAAFGAVVLVGGIGPAQAASPKACHTKYSTRAESRDVTGVVIGMDSNGRPIYGRGVQHRTVTYATTKCPPKRITVEPVSATPWVY